MIHILEENALKIFSTSVILNELKWREWGVRQRFILLYSAIWKVKWDHFDRSLNW